MPHTTDHSAEAAFNPVTGTTNWKTSLKSGEPFDFSQKMWEQEQPYLVEGQYAELNKLDPKIQNYIVQIPPNYRARVGGNAQVTVRATSPYTARAEVVKAGIPGAAIGVATPVSGNITYGSLPPLVNQFMVSFKDNPVLKYALGAQSFNQPTGIGAEKFGGGEYDFGSQISGDQFAPNINPLPTMEEFQAATPYQINTPEDPFYQPPGYTQLTTEDFERIRKKAAAGTPSGIAGYGGNTTFDINSMLGGSNAADSFDPNSAWMHNFNKDSLVFNPDEDLFETDTLDFNPQEDLTQKINVSDYADNAWNMNDDYWLGESYEVESPVISTVEAGEAGGDPPPPSNPFNELLNSVKAGELGLYTDGTFGVTAFENPAFWDAIFSPQPGTDIGTVRAAMFDAMAAQLAASAPNEFEANRAVKEFYKQAERQANARGEGDLETASGQTLNIYAFNKAKTESTTKTSVLDQSDADNAKNDVDTVVEDGTVSSWMMTDSGSGIDGSVAESYEVDKTNPAKVASIQGGEYIPIQDIISTFELMNPGQRAVYRIPELDSTGMPIRDAQNNLVFTEVVNPLLALLIDSANFTNGYISEAAIAEAQNIAAVEVATLQKDSALAIAEAQGASDIEIAGLVAEADKHVADAQAAATKAAASSAAGGQKGAAQATAGAASPYGFIAQGASQPQITDVLTLLAAEQVPDLAAAGPYGFALAEPTEKETQIVTDLIAAGLSPQEAQAEAAKLAAQGNIWSYAAGQPAFDINQLAQIASNTPAALAARGQIEAAQAQASPFGALSVGDEYARANANAILRAQAATNPYAATQLGQEAGRVDQILRGGLTPEQRLAEINAAQASENFANQLAFMSNPSAIGFATERGLLQDINNSPEGNIPGSLFGFNSPTASGAGGQETTTPINPNLSTLRNASDEQIGFLQGAAAAQGTTPSEFQQGLEAYTPQGI